MGKCELLETCPFFQGKLGNKPDQIDELKEKYCLSNNLNCARYMIVNSLGRDNMPDDLYPHEKDRAYLHIAQNG